MNYIIVTRNGAFITIHAEYNGVDYGHMNYLYFSKRDAIARYRKTHGLQYKHLTLIEY